MRAIGLLWITTILKGAVSCTRLIHCQLLTKGSKFQSFPVKKMAVCCPCKKTDDRRSIDSVASICYYPSLFQILRNRE